LHMSAARSDQSVDSNTLAGTGDSAHLQAANISIHAKDDIRKPKRSKYNVKAAGGGAISGSAAGSDITVRQNADVGIGDSATLKTIGRGEQDMLELWAENDFDLFDRAKLDTGGVIDVALVNTSIDVKHSKAGVSVGKNAILDSRNKLNLWTR